MKNLIGIFGIAAIFFSTQIMAQDSTQTQNRVRNQQQALSAGFVDENGDGFNDNAMDADGDGIPNGMDPDYDGAMARNGANSKGFSDEDGDGINDNAMDSDGDGIPNGQDADYTRPADGLGAQRGMNGGSGQIGTGTGECDETGPKGKGGKR